MAEAIYIFGTPYYFSDPAKLTPEQQMFAKQVRTYWANFARTGNPNGTLLPQWPQVSANTNDSYSFQALAPKVIAPQSSFNTIHNCDYWK